LIKIHKILEKIKLLLSSRAFKKNPLSTCFNVIYLFLLILINKKKKISLKFGKNIFYFIIKNYSQGFGARGVFVFREYYEPLFEFGHNFLKDGDTILDIGANHGIYSLAFSSVGKNTKVIAVEPFNFYKKIIKDNSKINNFNNIFFINRVVSNCKKYYNLDYSRSYLTASIIKKFKLKKRLKKILSITIDDLIKKLRIKKLDFIKMNIEGAEILALEGAKNTIKKFLPTIAMECSIEQFRKIKLPKNYKKFILTSKGELRKSLFLDKDQSTIILINKKKLNQIYNKFFLI
jgi:FkbM family methyltransferase